MPEKKKSLFARIVKNRWKSVIIVLIVFAILRRRSPRKSSSPGIQDFSENRDIIVGTGDLATVLTIQGSTQFSDSQKLTFMNKGKVKSVNVKVGDLVKKGQILATITTDDLDDQVEQARINLDDAKQALQDLLNGYNLELEMLQQQANYNTLFLKQQTIDQDHALVKEELEQKIKDAKKNYEDTKADYEELLSGSNSATADLALSSTIRKRNTTFQKAVFDIKSELLKLQTTLDAYDQIMLLTDKFRYMDSSTKIYIGAKDQNLKNQSESMFWTLSSQIAALASGYARLEPIAVADLTNNDILGLYRQLETIGTTMMNRGDINYDMFKASIETNSFPQKTINEYANTYGTTIQKEGISYITMYNTIVNTLDDLESDTSVEDTKLKMEKYKTALDKLELQKELLLTTQQQEKTKLLDDIATTQRNITKIKNGESLNESKIKQARNGVTQRQNSLNSLLDKYGDYRLKANFDGVITQMDIQVGDSIDMSSNATPKYIYVENNNILEMILSVEQVDIVKLKMGMEVIVYLDAYPNSSYRGVISEVNTVPTTAGGITTYSVKITFEKNHPEEVILAGMGGNAKIITSQTKNVLIVPNQAISRKDGKNVVLRLNANIWKDQEVEIGTSDENNTEILSGLVLGDTIKSMYITVEGMENAGITTVEKKIDVQEMMRQDQQNSMRSMERQYGGNGGGGNAGGNGGGGVRVKLGPGVGG